MTTVSALCPLSLNTIFDVEGIPVRPARAYFFHAQTQNPLQVWQDALLSIPHQQPVQTSGNGRIPVIFVGTDAYRVRIFDAFGGLVEDIDGIPGAITPSGGSGGGGGTINPGDPTLIATGDMIASFSNALRAGFVRCNGYTIGSATSGATERANVDTMLLFKWLWNQDVGLMLPIPGGRGTSADGDWAANKQITLPDFRSRGLFGMDGMGAPNTNRLTGAIFDTGDQTKLAAAGGRATHVLTAAEIPAHNHGASGLSDSIGGHTHTGGTDVQGLHVHNVPQGGGGASVPAGSAVSTAATQLNQVTDAQGSHAHTLSINSAGVHQHVLNITVANSGGGGAHDQVPPFQTAMIYIKL